MAFSILSAALCCDAVMYAISTSLSPHTNLTLLAFFFPRRIIKDADAKDVFVSMEIASVVYGFNQGYADGGVCFAFLAVRCCEWSFVIIWWLFKSGIVWVLTS